MSGVAPIDTILVISTLAGAGIQSSTAAADATHATSLGFAENSQLNYASVDGIPVDSTTILIKYTFYGDTNLDGSVDTVDFNILASNFGGSNKHWALADFNFDGSTDTVDFNLLAANFSKSGL